MRIHFIAIGGSIMHNLAISLAKMGHHVTGSDDLIVEPSKSRLLEVGLLPEKEGWSSNHITTDLDAVILGRHAEADNIELLKAQELGLKIYSFPEFIYDQCIHKTRVVIAGTYGKTTITSMVMHVLKKLGREFDYLIGAKLEGFDSLIKLTPNNSIMIIEGDEFYASSIDNHAKFHYYKPNIALLSNIQWDDFKMHISEDKYLKQFELFVGTICPKGTLIYNKDDKGILRILNDTKACKINRHGYNLPAYSINKGKTFIKIGVKEIPLQVIGKQNLSNIAGAYTVCEWLGVKRDEFFEAIQDFKTSIRYLEFVAAAGNSVVYQDFAHSPAKLRTSIHAVKEQFPQHKLLSIIEMNPYFAIEEDKLNFYRNSMNESEIAVVFINKNSTKEKNINFEYLLQAIKSQFNHHDLEVIYELDGLHSYLYNFNPDTYNMLFMSSKNYSGVNMLNFADKFLSKS